MTRDCVQVVIAAAGLGTRVPDWSQILPKEFQPVDGRPGLLHLLDELVDGGAEKAILVYNPYYEPFMAWASQTLLSSGRVRYQEAAGLPPTASTPREQLQLSFIRQDGLYADVTSVINATSHFSCGDILVAYPDNLYGGTNPLRLMRAAPHNSTAVLTRPFNLAEAGYRGVVITDSHSKMISLVEKPNPWQAHHLLRTHGCDKLRLLEGRFRLSAHFVNLLGRGTSQNRPGEEPKLSLALGAYARNWPVHVITTTAGVLDLGLPTPGSMSSIQFTTKLAPDK
jgi:UTP-glucose-1-phosphate uridylyltransferase